MTEFQIRFSSGYIFVWDQVKIQKTPPKRARITRFPHPDRLTKRSRNWSRTKVQGDVPIYYPFACTRTRRREFPVQVSDRPRDVHRCCLVLRKGPDKRAATNRVQESPSRKTASIC